MPIKISTALRSKLPESEREEIAKRLWDKSAQLCFLCGAKLVEATDSIVADHDIPEAEGGTTEISNLNLVHDDCNSFKRNHPTVSVRPYLKLLSKIRESGGFVKYDEAAALLGINSKPVDILDKGSVIELTSSTGTKQVCPVFSEKNKEATFRFCFAELPKDALINDAECQPRTIKPQHLWQIFNDICRNPLHEAPACRILPVHGSVNSYKILLFDGQHKTLAFWIAGRNSIVTKIYLDLSKEAAVRLVNSIQAKIKKLPLSPFELAAKMSEEWQERVAKYEADVGTEKASEDGFLKWVEKDERSRAKSAFEDALFEDVISDEALLLRKIVQRPGQTTTEGKVTESTFKGKVLKQLLHVSPLKEPFQESQKLRERERTTAIKILNVFYDKAFSAEALASPQGEVRAKRLLYQSTLSYVAILLRRLVGHILVTDDPRQLLEKAPDSERWSSIETAIGRLLDHPVWTAALDSSEKMKAVKDALQKNQDAAGALGSVSLKVGYLIGADPLDPNCLKP